MKLLDVILFVLAFCLLIIGVHQAMVVGLAEAYWIFMFSLMLVFLYNYRKKGKVTNSPKKGQKPGRTQKNG